MSQLSPSIGADATQAISAFRSERRKFVAKLGAAAAAIGMTTLAARSADAALPLTFKAVSSGGKRKVVDSDILNFALNFEYLGAEFYSIAANGTRLSGTLTTGTGTRGTVTGGRKVDTFVSSPNSVVAQLAQELAADETGHVRAVRALAGRKAVAEPNINIGTAWTEAAIAAGIITTGQTFDPYLNDANFLLAAFTLEDVCVTALNGGSVYIQNPEVLAAASSLLGTEAYQAGSIRTLLFGMGQSDATILTNAAKISNLRDTADGPGDDDQPLTDANGKANIIPTDANSLAFARTFQQVINIAYLSHPTGGGFFPSRLNGNIR